MKIACVNKLSKLCIDTGRIARVSANV